MVCLVSLQSRDCARLGPPSEGQSVQVRWTDGLLYGAKFVASHSVPMYMVNNISVSLENSFRLYQYQA